MATTDPRIDAYIEAAADFARPILRHLRQIVHAGCPDVEETMKWGMPYFMHKGMLCGMAAFKQHCTFGFWQGARVLDADKVGTGEAMGQFGRIASIRDLPPKKVMIAYVKKAVEVNEAGTASRRATKAGPARATRAVIVPEDLAAALGRSRKARTTFEKFSPSHRREYVDWITEAKTDATRERRVATAIEWLEEGKARHWKYER